MLGNRPSALPTSEFCGMAAELNIGAGRPAAISTGFHRLSAGVPERKALAGLTEDEKAEVFAMQAPSDTVIRHEGGETVLRYSDAEKETEFALTAYATPTTREAPDCLSAGTEDMGWTVEVAGHRIAYSGDIKRTEWTASDGPESLQLAFYAFGRAARDGADMLCTGIWAAKEGKWHWGELVNLESDAATDLWERIVHAATNKGGDFATGAHCRSCWSRFRCPTLLLPKEHFGGTQLDAMTKTDPSHEELTNLVLMAQAQKDMAEQALSFAKAHAERLHGIRDPKTGKVYRAIPMPGKESVDMNKLMAEVTDYGRFIKVGKGYDQYRWVKA